MDLGLKLATAAALYQTRVSTVTVPAGDSALILGADPQRWYVRFQAFGAVAADAVIAPGTGLPLPPVGTGPIQPTEAKFWDCPSIVTGDWYAYGAGGTTIVIWECILTRS